MDKKKEIKIKILEFLKQHNYQLESLFEPVNDVFNSLEDCVVKKSEETVTLRINDELGKKLSKYDEKIINEAFAELFEEVLKEAIKLEKLQNEKK